MDEIDRLLVDALQEGMPVCAHPFRPVAARAGLTEEEVVARIQCLLQNGSLSRFGPMFNVEAFGGAYVLAAMQVSVADLEAIVEQLNGYPEVAHNYLREHRFNVWFVVAAPTPAQAEVVLGDIEQRTGLPVCRLPKVREYFVGARFAA
jgi:DNA-binding Lrp family transcriptional regulator